MLKLKTLAVYPKCLPSGGMSIQPGQCGCLVHFSLLMHIHTPLKEEQNVPHASFSSERSCLSSPPFSPPPFIDRVDLRPNFKVYLSNSSIQFTHFQEVCLGLATLREFVWKSLALAKNETELKTIGFIHTKNKIEFLIISLPKNSLFHFSTELKKQANPS